MQQVYRGSDYADMVANNYKRHVDYCKSLDCDFLVHYGNVIEEWPLSHGGWAKIPLLKRYLLDGYDKLVWLDSDAVIADLDADIFDGCPEFGIGMTHNPKPKPHFNVGMMYITNSQDVIDFFDIWLGWYPGPINGWHEQAMLNLLVAVPKYTPYVTAIDFKYNSCEEAGTHVENAVVEAFHGGGSASERLESMLVYLERMKR